MNNELVPPSAWPDRLGPFHVVFGWGERGGNIAFGVCVVRLSILGDGASAQKESLDKWSERTAR